MMWATCLKARPSPLVWCGGAGGGTVSCSEGDIDLVTGLLSWWQLTDGVSLVSGADQGPLNLDLNPDGPLYTAGIERGGEPGAALFPYEGAFANVSDPSGFYISTENAITIGLWLRLDDKGASTLILSYMTGAPYVTRYELAYDDGADRFVWSMRGVSGAVSVVANTLGSPTAGQWYWMELTYDPATTLAGIRVAPTRTADLEALDIDADTAVVPGGLAEVPGSFNLGHSGSPDSMRFPGFELDSFSGALAGVGFWARTLNVCERGRLNMPTDYPFAEAVAAGFESEGGDSFVAEDGSTTFDPE